MSKDSLIVSSTEFELTTLLQINCDKDQYVTISGTEKVAMTACWCAQIQLPRHGMAWHHNCNNLNKLYTNLDFHKNHLGHICAAVTLH